MTKQLEILRARAAEAQSVVQAEIQRIQNSCAHPITQLVFSYSGVTSSKFDCIEHGMTIRCSGCGSVFGNTLVIHKD